MGAASRLPGGIATIAVCVVLLMAVVIPVVTGMASTLDTRISGTNDLTSDDRMVQSSSVTITISSTRADDFYISVDGGSPVGYSAVKPFVVVSPSARICLGGTQVYYADSSHPTGFLSSFPVTIAQSSAGLTVTSGSSTYTVPGNPWVMYTYLEGFPAATHAATDDPAVAGDSPMLDAAFMGIKVLPVPNDGYEFAGWQYTGDTVTGDMTITATFEPIGGNQKASGEDEEEGGEDRVVLRDTTGYRVVFTAPAYGLLKRPDSDYGLARTIVIENVPDGSPISEEGDSIIVSTNVGYNSPLTRAVIYQGGSATDTDGRAYSVTYTTIETEDGPVQAVSGIGMTLSDGYAILYAPYEWEASTADPVLMLLLGIIPLLCVVALFVLICRWAIPGRDGKAEDVFNSR